jgi:hypothetical protein
MRRDLDFYETPQWATRVLLEELPIRGMGDMVTILEPCHGEGAITRELLSAGHQVQTNDVNPSTDADTHLDAAYGPNWRKWYPHWVITNPPFIKAREIFRHAYDHAKEGVALLLRLSFLEPTDDRGELLWRLPPDELIVLPRISFTGDGNTDSVTCAWMIWHKQYQRRRIQVIPKPSTDAVAPLFADGASA